MPDAVQMKEWAMGDTTIEHSGLRDRADKKPAWTVVEMAIRHDDIEMLCLMHYR